MKQWIEILQMLKRVVSSYKKSRNNYIVSYDIRSMLGAVFELQYNAGILRRPETSKSSLFSSERHPINKGCGHLLSLMQQNLRALPPRVCDCAATWKCSGF